jgi:hypothetical protein
LVEEANAGRLSVWSSRSTHMCSSVCIVSGSVPERLWKRGRVPERLWKRGRVQERQVCRIGTSTHAARKEKRKI